jgi:cellulose synthase/poly-beta-1,6-N-acetylglucosamine synthase-like glycosyltransferase
LARLVAPLEQDAGIDAVSGFYEARGQTWFERCAALVTLPVVSVDPRTYLPSARSIALRKRAWEAVGGFPEHLEFAEDTTFDLALKEAGFRFAFAPDALVYWRPPGNMRGVYDQCFNYAAGNAQAKVLRRVYVRIYLRYLVWTFLTAGVLLRIDLILPWVVAVVPYWCLWPVRGWLAYRDWRVAFAAPFVKLVADIAKMLGFASGSARRDRA